MEIHPTFFLAGSIFGLVLTAQTCLSQETAPISYLNAPVLQFGSPDSVSNRLDEDTQEKRSLTGQDFLGGYREWKEQFYEQTGISFAFDYTSGGHWPSNTISGRDSFTSGAVRFYGSWELVGRGTKNTGTFVWKGEHRHRYSKLPASAAAKDIGYAGLSLPNLSDSGFRLTNFYWKQNLRDGRLEIIAGMLDVTDWTDAYALASPWTGFFNFAFSTGSATIPTPDDATLGAFVNGMITDNLYFVAGLTDANSDSTDPLKGFDTFGKGEFFKVLELGWTASQDRFFLDNTHVTFWHVDERKDAGVPDGWGAAFSYSRSINEKVMPFFRAGYAKDGGSFLQKSVSAGLGYHFGENDSLLGVGLNWGQVNKTTYGSGLKDQVVGEIFTRLQVSENIQFTPNIQYIKNPALNPGAGHSVVLGLRMRTVF